MSATRLQRAGAWLGALLFAASLAWFAECYTARFGDAGGSWTPATARALVVDVALFTIFALHHSIAARLGLKTRIGVWFGAASERTIYVSIASGLFALTCGGWRPLAGTLWTAAGPWAMMLRLAQTAGVVVTAWSASRLDVLELAGVRQVSRHEARPPVLLQSGLYGVVRHPIYLGWLLLVWPVPTMTMTRAVFAGLSSAYLAAAVPFEERDLRRTFGEAYAAYAARVRWRLVPFIY